jgi:hypothetical protein
MYIYCLATDSDLQANRLKIGETETLSGVEERRTEFDKTFEPLYTRAIWNIGERARGSDKVLHRYFRDKLLRAGGYEWFGDITLDEVNEAILYICGPEIKRIK